MVKYKRRVVWKGEAPDFCKGMEDKGGLCIVVFTMQNIFWNDVLFFKMSSKGTIKRAMTSVPGNIDRKNCSK